MNRAAAAGTSVPRRPTRAEPPGLVQWAPTAPRRADAHISTSAGERALVVRPLQTHHVEQALAITGLRPYAHCFLTSLLERGAIDDLVGVFDAGEMRAVASVAGNCVATDLQADTARALADHLALVGRRVASIVCRQPDVTLLWEALAGRWGTPREVRLQQPLLVLDGPPLVEPDPAVRRGQAGDFTRLLPCCVEMFTAEVGVSPFANGMEGAYRRRIEHTIETGRSFLRTDDGRVVFKAEIGAISSAACQVQGVWVRPERRGQGLGAAGMAAVAVEARRSIAPAVELYVNDFNTAARTTYARVGFEQVDTFRTVFF